VRSCISANIVGNSWTAGQRRNFSSSPFIWRLVTANSYRELPLTITNWKSTEPNNLGGVESCLMLNRDYNYAWDDVGCEYRHNSVCEIEIEWNHRRSQGVQWVHLHPQGGEKFFFRPNLQEKCESAPPSQRKSQFLGQFLLGGLDLEVYLDGLCHSLRGRRLKKSKTFLGKSAPTSTKSWLRLCMKLGSNYF